MNTPAKSTLRGARKLKKDTPAPAESPRGGARLIADRAGVSLMTVSRALNGTEGIAESTRRKILQIAEEIGYQPNFSAQTLRRGQSDTVAMLLDSSMGVRGEYHSDSLAGFEQVISTEGYNLLLMVPRSEEGIPGLIRRLVASTRCLAVVLRFDILKESDLELMRAYEAPIVFASPTPAEFSRHVKASAAYFDNKGGIARAVRHLVALGHRRIAYIGGTPGWVDAQERVEAFRDELGKHQIEVVEDWIRAGDFAQGFESGRGQMAGILSARLPMPTAVVCAADKIAAGAVDAARRWGLSVPENLSVVGFDDDSWTSFASPPLTTIRQDGLLLGQTLGRLTLEEVGNPQQPGRQVVLDTPLIVRGSTAPPAEEKSR